MTTLPFTGLDDGTKPQWSQPKTGWTTCMPPPRIGWVTTAVGSLNYINWTPQWSQPRTGWMSGVRANDDAVALGTAMEPTEDGRMTHGWRGTLAGNPAAAMEPGLGSAGRRVSSALALAKSMAPQWSRPRIGRMTDLPRQAGLRQPPAAMEPTMNWPGNPDEPDELDRRLLAAIEPA